MFAIAISYLPYRPYVVIRAHLIRNWAPHVINSYVHLAVSILSGKKNEVVRLCYVLLVVRHDFRIYMNEEVVI